MVSDFFCKMDLSGQDPVIVALNVSAKEARRGQINFPVSPTDDDYRAIGYWPETGTRPAEGPWQRVTGPVRTPNAQAETVERVYTTTNFTLAERKTAMKAAITAKRWAVETAGITVSGAAIATDVATQAKLSGALQLVQDDNTVVIDWKGANGVWVQLNAAAVTAIARAVGLHVQACFTREKELHAAVDDAANAAALDLIDIEAGSIDSSGAWPS